MMVNRTKTILRRLAPVVLAHLSACAFNFELTSQRTALENQILGNYKELDDDLIVTNYDRNSFDPNLIHTQSSQISADLDKAQKNRLFNSDDIFDLKEDGLLAETDVGQLTVLPKGVGSASRATPEQIKLAEVLVDEENRDRTIIWQFEVNKLAAPTEKVMPKIREDFYKQIYQSAPKGHWFLIAKKWVPKS